MAGLDPLGDFGKLVTHRLFVTPGQDQASRGAGCANVKGRFLGLSSKTRQAPLHPSRTFAGKPGDGGFGEAVPFTGKTR